MKMKEINLPVPRLRSITAQFVASMAPNLLLLDLGMAVGFVTIAMPDLLNGNDALSLTDKQASWFGSIAFLAQTLGALVSGPLMDYFGRKTATFLVNIPHVVAWILMYFVWNLPSLFIANALLGFGSAMMEGPVCIYFHEISESSVRGALSSITQVFLSVGMSIIYVVGAAVNWRVAALICLSMPIITMLLAITVVPETPVWLLSQGRQKDALKSLCYLRGWTTPENVREEFDNLVEYAKTIECCVICNEESKVNEEKHEITATDCKHQNMNIFKRFFIKFKIVMLCKETLRPLVFSLFYFTFFVMNGLFPTKPYLGNICGAMGMADDRKTIVIMVGVLSILGSIIVLGSIKYLGKRKLGLGSMFGSAIRCTGLSVYAYTHLNDDVFSYDSKTFPKEKSMVPLVFLYGLTIFDSINVSWILLGEVFPYRSRATSQGIAAAWNYIVSFIGAKTLIDLETNFKLAGAFATYAAFSYIGTVFLYFFMPETEGKPLQEIESFYNGILRIFADDWFINKFKKSKK